MALLINKKNIPTVGMAKYNPIIEEKGTINPTQLKVLRKWEAQMNSESLGDFRKDISSFFALALSFDSDPLQNSVLVFFCSEYKNEFL